MSGVVRAEKATLLPQGPREVEISAGFKTNLPNIDPFILFLKA